MNCSEYGRRFNGGRLEVPKTIVMGKEIVDKHNNTKFSILYSI